jgi:predicted nuclease with TOPRIM domain
MDSEDRFTYLSDDELRYKSIINKLLGIINKYDMLYTDLHECIKKLTITNNKKSINEMSYEIEKMMSESSAIEKEIKLTEKQEKAKNKFDELYRSIDEIDEFQQIEIDNYVRKNEYDIAYNILFSYNKNKKKKHLKN